MSYDYLLVDEKVKILIKFIIYNSLYTLFYYLKVIYSPFLQLLYHFVQNEAIHASVQSFEAWHIVEQIPVGSIYKIDDF